MSGPVLVVGVDGTVTEFVAAVLRRGGLDARPVRSDLAAPRANDDEPALVLVDSDLSAVRSIRSLADPHRAGVPIVVLGADGADANAGDEATAAGATHYVARPIADAVLINGIRTILDAG